MTFRFHQQIQHLQKIEDLNHEYIAKFSAKLIQHSRDSTTTHQVLDLGLYFHDDVRDILEINMGQKMETDTVLQSLVAKHQGNCQLWTWDSKDVRDVQQALHALYPPSSAGNLKGVPVNQEAYLHQITQAPLRNVSIRDRSSFGTWQDRIFTIRSAANSSGHGEGIDVQITKLIVTKLNKIFSDDIHRPDDTNFVVDLAKAFHQKYPMLKPHQPGQPDSYYPSFIQLMTILGSCWHAEWAIIDRLVRKGLQVSVPTPSAKIPKKDNSDHVTGKGRDRDRSSSDLDAQKSKKPKGPTVTNDKTRCPVCGRYARKHENGVCPYSAHPDRGSVEQPYLSTARAKVALEEFGLAVLPESWHCETGVALKPEQIRAGGPTHVANLERLTPEQRQAKAKKHGGGGSDAANSVNSGYSSKKVTIAQPAKSAIKGGGQGAGTGGYNHYKSATSQSKPR
jgi:hypothetical protein